jgi:hypothetical protein
MINYLGISCGVASWYGHLVAGLRSLREGAMERASPRAGQECAPGDDHRVGGTARRYGRPGPAGGELYQPSRTVAGRSARRFGAGSHSISPVSVANAWLFQHRQTWPGRHRSSDPRPGRCSAGWSLGAMTYEPRQALRWPVLPQRVNRLGIRQAHLPRGRWQWDAVARPRELDPSRARVRLTCAAAVAVGSGMGDTGAKPSTRRPRPGRGWACCSGDGSRAVRQAMRAATAIAPMTTATLISPAHGASLRARRQV